MFIMHITKTNCIPKRTLIQNGLYNENIIFYDFKLKTEKLRISGYVGDQVKKKHMAKVNGKQT